MTAIPDILLPGTGLSASRPNAPTPADSRRDADAARFADVYAREREARPAERPAEPPKREARNDGQARAAERGQAPAHARRHERVGERPDEAEQTQASAGEPTPVEGGNDGKDLPPEEVLAEAPSDVDEALALLGLEFTEPAVTVEAATAEVSADTSLADTEAALAQGIELPAAEDATLLAVAAPTTAEVSEEAAVVLEEQALASSALTGKGTSREALGLPTTAAESAAASSEVEASASEQSQAEGVLTELAESLPAGQEARESFKDNLSQRLNGLTQALAQQPGSAPRAAPLVPGQPLAMQQGGMSEALVDRVMWMSSQNLKSAEIQLDPAELGRMEVRIEMNKDQAQVTFLSPHAGVREALEGQSQRLRDMFSQQGLNLADVNVSDQSQARGWQGQGGEQGRGEGRGRSLASDDEVAVSGSTEIAANRQNGQRGLVDYYA